MKPVLITIVIASVIAGVIWGVGPLWSMAGQGADASDFSIGDTVTLKLDGTKGMIIGFNRSLWPDGAYIRVRVSTPGHPILSFYEFELEKSSEVMAPVTEKEP